MSASASSTEFPETSPAAAQPYVGAPTRYHTPLKVVCPGCQKTHSITWAFPKPNGGYHYQTCDCGQELGCAPVDHVSIRSPLWGN